MRRWAAVPDDAHPRQEWLYLEVEVWGGERTGSSLFLTKGFPLGKALGMDGPPSDGGWRRGSSCPVMASPEREPAGGCSPASPPPASARTGPKGKKRLPAAQMPSVLKSVTFHVGRCGGNAHVWGIYRSWGYEMGKLLRSDGFLRVSPKCPGPCESLHKRSCPRCTGVSSETGNGWSKLKED